MVQDARTMSSSWDIFGHRWSGTSRRVEMDLSADMISVPLTYSLIDHLTNINICNNVIDSIV